MFFKNPLTAIEAIPDKVEDCKTFDLNVLQYSHLLAHLDILVF